jgi:hypothetical protein
MATIIPATPVGSLPPEVLKTFRLFKTFPDDFTIWHHLTPWEPDAPDFLLIDPDRRALLVKVSTQSDKEARSAGQMLLTGDERSQPGETQETALRAFLEKLGPDVSAQVPCLVLFPNIPAKHLTAKQPGTASPSISWSGQEMLQPGNLPAWLALFCGKRLRDFGVELLRTHFTPESRVPASLTVRPVDDTRQRAGLGDYLLDSRQELAVKNDLELPLEQQNASKDFHVGIINGVAGSGKTLILLYRLRLLEALFPQKSFLVLTHNRPLIRDLKARYRRLTVELPHRVVWETFNGFCRRHWPESDEYPWTNPLARAPREKFIQAAWEKYFAGSSITADSLDSELDWFKDQIPMDKATYLAVQRKGRGFRLNQEQRVSMWDAMMEYQSQLKAKKSVDWGDVPRRMWHLVNEGQLDLPMYDVVLIDEAQFFAPIWFDIIRRIVRPKSGHLFIVADPTQGFLGRGTSWKSLGVDARGRTQNLRRSYRTTHEILNFATLFYRKRVTRDDTDDEILEPDLMNMPRGVLPVLLPVRSAQDEVSIVATEIALLHKHGYPLRDLLVLHAEYGVDALIETLNRHLGEGKAVDPKNALPEDCVRVTTLNAGTGLESPIVFLVGLNRLFEREQSLRLSEEEAERLVLENTRKVYMAATRAGQRLVITYVGPVPEVIKELLG